MRTFSCFTSDPHSDVPTLSFVLAQTLDRARELARRELFDIPGSVAVEIMENGKVLEVLFREPALG
jgi:hypothetical protein